MKNITGNWQKKNLFYKNRAWQETALNVPTCTTPMGSASITAASSMKKTIDSLTAKTEPMKEILSEPNMSENIFVWTLTCISYLVKFLLNNKILN